MREDRRPVLVEAVTYRFRGHSMADPEQYRTKEEVAQWRARDPIPAFGELLAEKGVIDEGDLARIDAEATERVDAAVAFAEASPFPAPESLYDDVYVLEDAVRGSYSVRTTAAPSSASESARQGSTDEDRTRRDPPADHDRAAGRRGRLRMAQMRYREALNAALREELSRDERVVLMGEDIGVFGGAFKVTEGLLEEFGEARVRDTPISENTIVGVGVGAAMTGLRPVVELMTINFALLAFDQIVNHAAHIHYMFGGQARVPLVVRMPQGAGHQLGPTHSHCLEALFLHVPGLLVAVPSTAGRRQGPVEDRDPRREPGHLHRARVAVRGARRGARGPGPPRGLRARPHGPRGLGCDDRGDLADGPDGRARRRHARGRARREAEVIDPRTLRPLDLDTILASVAKTNRCVVVEEGWPHGGVGANLAALISEQAFDDLDAPVQRVTGADVPMPYSKPLEDIAYPHEPQIVARGA